MKRDEIIKSDFPTARKGYDRAAVDAHLRKVADAADRSAGEPSLADAAAQKVGSIIEAAEAKAKEIEADARREADQLLSKARAEAGEQIERAQDSVSKLVGQADELRERVSAMAREVGGADTTAETEPQIVPEPTIPEPEVDPTPVVVPEPEPPATPEPEPLPMPEREPEPELPAASSNGADEQAARLVAMKMVLDGSSRDEVEKHLADSYALADAGKLLDEVFARAGR
jgi:DivIVA domain-containing protein